MDLFKDFFKKDKTGSKELIKERKKSKDNISKRLKKQLFMTNNEVEAVISLIEDYEKKVDELKENFDFVNFDETKWQECVKKMYKVEEEMKEDVEGFIKFLMNKKLERAEEFHKKKQEK